MSELVDELPTTRPRYYVHYADDGPSGPCGQSVENTAPWNKLYVFRSSKTWLDFIHDVGVETFRRNARVLGAWAEGDDHYEQVTAILPEDR